MANRVRRGQDGRPQSLRIIAGRWRGRRLPLADVLGLRPTPDRIRETLFNWLGARVAGARCLDLFAGSGALGLEALSRGAAAVTLVERDRVAASRLRANLTALGADRCELRQADALVFLQAAPEPFDIVFLDPPFRQGLLARCIAELERGWLGDEADVYLEAEQELGAPVVPEGWRMRRNGRAGQVGYFLARRER